MYNVKVVIKPEETFDDLVEELLSESNKKPDDRFIFSAIYEPKQNAISLNIAKTNNAYTARDVVKELFNRIQEAPEARHYLNAPLDKWLTQFRPSLISMVDSIYLQYEKCYPDKQDLLQILYESIIILYNKGYYLHKSLIFRSFVNRLNRSIRKSKHFTDTVSFESPVKDEGNLTLADVIADENDSLSKYEEDDYTQFLFNEIKKIMLESMSQLSFDMLMIQLENKCIMPSSAKALMSVRKKIGSKYVPRPNRRNK